MSDRYDFVAIGGGAAGFFGAIAFATSRPGSRVAILEKSRSVLGKVKISGGGRCNVTHACFDPRALTENYPRGGKNLIGAFHRWGAAETVEWFESRGVPLKTESDGRIFPRSDSSESVIRCLQEEAAERGVCVQMKRGVETLKPVDGEWRISTDAGSDVTTSNVLLSSGGVRNGSGQKLAGDLGHRVIEAAPSLFTFKIDDPRIENLSGVSVRDVEARVVGSSLRSSGPCLITHWGMSGPAILKLSAWGARELHQKNYRFEISINWLGGRRPQEVEGDLRLQREVSPKRKISNRIDGFPVPSRLWQRLVEGAGIAREVTWSNLSRTGLHRLCQQLTDSRFPVDGKSMNKEEFVTAGGIDLREVNFKTMESRLFPGLFFAGEVLDIDGVTGGFNFQAAWTTSKIAGDSAASG